MEDKYIGLILAVLSTIAIGGSYVITKKGLEDATQRHGFEGDGFQYLKNPIWWAGMVTMVLGEIANFAAYAFAPAILVTPLGALTVLSGAILGAYFLKEELGVLGKIGSAICLLGSIIIASHAPPDKEIETVDEILNSAVQPGFLIYCVIMTVFSIVMIYKIAPVYGKRNPMYYLSICASTGSISVMALKAFGIALKLSLGGNNQFTHASTYAFIIVSVVCILCQMNYLNKALAEFSQSVVNPVYYVMFTTAVLLASFILFQGFNTTDTVNTISLLTGFIIIFLGVYLVNLSRGDPNGHRLLSNKAEDGIPTDGLNGLATRYSMQMRRSQEHRRSNSLGSLAGNGFANPGSQGARAGLIHSYDVEEGSYRLDDLVNEESEEEPASNGKQPKVHITSSRHV